SVTSVKIASFAVTSAKLDTSSVTSVKVASFAITSAALDTASVTSVKVASGAIGTTQLATTGVTAATYTAATITVGADGRITSASSGSAGAGMGIPVLSAVGPASGTYTASPTANRIGVYMWAGAGGKGSSNQTGGEGGYGFYNKPITQPFSQPYSIGAGGVGTGSGGATNVANVGTVNGGGGAPPNTTGTPGNAPGASLVGVRNQILYRGNYYPYPIPCSGPGFDFVNGYGTGRYTQPGVEGALIIFENTGT
ncbi:MAG: hypothetical protein EBX40_08650, partial [Gammaproteobacteria bacterium]|nr:hypothetical protein [Gammaproteobacteria bacterium]